MAIVVLLIVGIIVGALARLLLPGRDPIGIVGTIILGILGVFGGYYLGKAITPDNQGVPWIASIIVAVILLWLYRMVTHRRGTAV